MKRETQDEIRRHIRSDAVNKSIIPERQAWHDRNSSEYKNGRSYLLPGVDAQELVDRYHGTGYVPVSESGDWNREVVLAERNIGVNINPKTGEETVTNRFVIHYRKTGTHIVPTKQR